MRKAIKVVVVTTSGSRTFPATKYVRILGEDGSRRTMNLAELARMGPPFGSLVWKRPKLVDKILSMTIEYEED